MNELKERGLAETLCKKKKQQEDRKKNVGRKEKRASQKISPFSPVDHNPG